MSQRRAAGFLLWFSVIASGACAGSSDSPPGEAVPSGVSSAAPAQSAIPGHDRRSGSRCASCHTPEDRAHPRWKEIVGSLGHDVSGMLAERTSCHCCHLGDVKGFGEPIEERCLDCHDDVRVTIPKMASQHCVSCHRLGAGEGSDIVGRAWECQKCHTAPQGTARAVDIHGGEDCANCHRPHEEPFTQARPCVDCHEREKDARHGKPKDPNQFVCIDCHAPHEQAGEAAAKCADCHNELHPTQFRKARSPGHDACTTCHTPHAFERQAVKECASCHDEIKTMTGRGAADHAKCASCHEPHALGEPASSACSKCHKEVSSSHPDPKKQGCVSCHNPHPNDAAAHAGIGASPAVICKACHSSAGIQSVSHGGLECGRCHTPHREGDKVGIGCANCHGPEVTKTAASPGGKHAPCTSCHEGNVHRPTATTAVCGKCHSAEQGSAPKGHSDCASCHDSHSGRRLPGATCSSCHASESASAKAVGHGACNDCHRAHGPSGPESPPACVQCHSATAKSAGLHALAGHQTCSSCHGSAHAAAPKSDRATCLSCHSNMVNHQPDAKTCAGCHAFRGN